jgi:hypothetical protein
MDGWVASMLQQSMFRVGSLNFALLQGNGAAARRRRDTSAAAVTTTLATTTPLVAVVSLLLLSPPQPAIAPHRSGVSDSDLGGLAALGITVPGTAFKLQPTIPGLQRPGYNVQRHRVFVRTLRSSGVSDSGLAAPSKAASQPTFRCIAGGAMCWFRVESVEALSGSPRPQQSRVAVATQES